MVLLPAQAGDYERSLKKLTVASPPAEPYTLEIVTKIQPQNNTALEVSMAYRTHCQPPTPLWPIFVKPNWAAQLPPGSCSLIKPAAILLLQPPGRHGST
jgi:hypothetical protein